MGFQEETAGRLVLAIGRLKAMSGRRGNGYADALGAMEQVLPFMIGNGGPDRLGDVAKDLARSLDELAADNYQAGRNNADACGARGVMKRALKAIRIMSAASVGVPAFEACGCCGGYHAVSFGGDCRDDINRLDPDELDDILGPGGWSEISPSCG